MTKPLLETILKLFAITSYSGVAENYSVSIEKFLNHNLAEKHKDYYLNYFYGILESHASASSEKKVSLNSIRIIKYCEDIKSKVNLSKEDVLFIIISLCNFLCSSSKLNTQQKDFIILIADILETDSAFIKDLLLFVDGNYDDISNSKLTEYQFTENDKVLLLSKSKYEIVAKSYSTNIKINSYNSTPDNIYSIDFKTYVSCRHKNLSYSELNAIINYDTDIDKYKLHVNNLSVKIANNQILKDLSFSANSGELIAVIGKTGSGKSTLLKALSGVIDKHTDANFYIEKRIGNKDVKLVPHSTYVSQFGSFLESYTVEEHIRDRLSYLQIDTGSNDETINKILSKVDLISHKDKRAEKSNNKEGELSGGQKKRLSIAMALVENPDLILLDEPSSGLSATEANDLFRLLKTIALSNKIIICPVHQPDIEMFKMFDKLIVLNPNGETVYYGTPQDSVEYFCNKANRIDKHCEFNNQFNPSTILEIVEKYNIGSNNNNSSEKSDPNTNDKIKYTNISKKIKPLTSIKNFLLREANAMYKYKLSLVLYLIIPCILGFIIPFVSKFSTGNEYTYYLNPNIPVWVLMICVSAFFIGLISSGHEFILNKAYRKAENIIYNSTVSYKLSKLIKVLIISAFQAFVLCFISINIIEISGHALELFLIIFSLSLGGSLTGLLLSSIIKNLSLVYFIAPVIIIPQLLLAGAIIDFKEFHNSIKNDKYIPFIASAVPVRLAGEAIMTDLYKNNKYNQQFFRYNSLLNESAYYLNFFIPEINNIYDDNSEKAARILLSEYQKNNELPYNSNIDFKSNIKNIEKYYSNLMNNVVIKKDKLINSYDSHDLARLKWKYSNRVLSQICNQSHSKQNFIVKDDEIIRLFTPIYKMPDNNTIRTHFLSPYKSFNKYLINTYNYNLAVLSLINLLFIVLLFLFFKNE